MSNLQRNEQQSNVSRPDTLRMAGKFFTWLGTLLRIRHEAALRRRSRNVRLRPVNPTPV